MITLCIISVSMVAILKADWPPPSKITKVELKTFEFINTSGVKTLGGFQFCAITGFAFGDNIPAIQRKNITTSNFIRLVPNYANGIQPDNVWKLMITKRPVNRMSVWVTCHNTYYIDHK